MLKIYIYLTANLYPTIQQLIKLFHDISLDIIGAVYKIETQIRFKNISPLC